MLGKYIFKITIAAIEDYKWCETLVIIAVENVLFAIIIS
jgi:hypothetical protein